MSTYETAARLLYERNYEGAVSIAGPLLQANPNDLAAWHITARALFELGERDVAIKNLKSLVESNAAAGLPILALSIIKEMEEMGQDVDVLVYKMSELYGASSSKIEELDMAPPKLPINGQIPRWNAQGGNELVEKAKEVMAVAWGNSLMETELAKPLPFVPIFSALQPDEFCMFTNTLSRHSYAEGDIIIEQGSEGDALFIIAEGEVSVEREGNKLARLTSGAFFGEMALISRANRAATVRAHTHSVLLRADKEDIDELVNQTSDIGRVLLAFCHSRMLENLMQLSPVLSSIPITRRPDVIAQFTTDYYEAGSTIITEGEQAKGVFLIVSGEVTITKDEDGDIVNLATLSTGDVIGEISLLMQKPSIATATATENTAMLFLASSDFMKITSDYPELLKGAFDIALKREVENRSILAASTTDAEDLIIF